jgi:hypothetical protein
MLPTTYRPSAADSIIPLLALMSPEQIRKIVNLASARGAALVDDVLDYKKNVINVPAVLAPVDRIPASDVGYFITGLSVHLFAVYSRPNDPRYYSGLLRAAFGIDSQYADSLAAQIETPDAIKGLWNNLKEFARRKFNLILPDDFEISQDPGFDTDVLYETYKLGQIVAEMMKRANYVSLAVAYNFSSITNPSSTASGDPLEVAEDLTTLAMAVSPKPLTKEEMGGLGRWLSRAASFVSRNAGKILNNPVLRAATLLTPAGPFVKAGMLAAGKLAENLGTVNRASGAMQSVSNIANAASIARGATQSPPPPSPVQRAFADGYPTHGNASPSRVAADTEVTPDDDEDFSEEE